jgi:hypothetical protein
VDASSPGLKIDLLTLCGEKMDCRIWWVASADIFVFCWNFSLQMRGTPTT